MSAVDTLKSRLVGDVEGFRPRARARRNRRLSHARERREGWHAWGD